jgi:transcriptional regulator with XRE-family HTH domain
MVRGPRSPIDSEVGARVRALRIARGFSQTEVANVLGLTFQQLQKYEKGTNRIGPERLAALAKLFGVPVATLFGEDGKGAPVEVDTQLNTHTRRELLATLDKIGSTRLESVLLALVIEHANGARAFSRK